MTEPTTTDGTTTETSGSTSTAGDEFTPITSQEDLNRVIGERVKRAESKFGDYKDLKAKASKYDELEQANKTEIEKATERVTKAEAEVATIPAKVAQGLREHLVALHKIDADDAELFLTANDPELLLKQVDRLMGRTAERSAEERRNGARVSREGANSKPTEGEDREAVRGLFGGANT